MLDKIISWIKKNKKQVAFVFIGIPFIIYLISVIPILPSGGNDWAGFWGSYFGAIIGAGVTIWGITKTADENKKLGVAPYFIFEEIQDVPENTMVYGCFLNISGNSYTEKKVRITNVGNGTAIKIRIGKDYFTEIPLLKKDDSVYISLEYGIDIPSNNSIDKWSKEDIVKYCSQSKDTGIIVKYSDVLGNTSEYEIHLKLECDIDMLTSNYRVHHNLSLEKWKMK